MDTIYKSPFGKSPYYNDYDEKNNFYAMGFVPARAVQARELTQSYSILQNQIACAGSVWYRSGTPVSGCRITVSWDQPYFKIGTTDQTGQPIDPTLLVGLNYVGQTSGQMIHVIDCDATNRYLYFSYLGGELSDGELFLSTTTPTRSFYTVANTTSKAVNAKSTAGILFIDGYYVRVPAGNIIVAVDNQDALYNIGFSVKESIITESTDASLNDNSAGSTNYGAPGAHRLSLSAELYSFSGTTAPEDVRFISGITIENNRIIKEQSNPLSDTKLIDLLAKRTYDESGSYTVNPWKIQLYDIPNNASQYRIDIQEGLGYVRGYEVNTIVSTSLTVDKPRDTITKHNTSVFNESGCYALGLMSNNVLDAKNLPASKTNVNVMSGTNGTGSVLGTATIFNYSREGSQFRIYLINTSNVVNSFNGARSLVSQNDSTSYINLYINEDGYAELNGSEVPFIYSTGQENVNTIVDNSIQYQMVRKYTATSSNNNTLTILESNPSINMPTTEGLIAVYSGSKFLNVDELIMTPNNTDTVSYAIISGDAIQNNTQYTVYVKTNSDRGSQRSKTLTTVTETFTVLPNVSVKTLGNADILDIVSIVQSSNTNDKTPDDLKQYLNFNNGQSDYYYNNGSLSGFNSDVLNTFKNSVNASTQYQVTYRYFIHSGSGPFTVDSYVTSQNQSAYGSKPIYDAIPTYTADNGTTYRLTDCFDFRTKSSDATNTFENVPIPRTELIADVTKYLPRIDALYVASNGEFGILPGISSENPVEPIGNEYIMVLYYLENKPYVRSVSDVGLTYVDNRRYTMKDIGKLNTRLTNVEDMVSLNQLEQSAVNMQITDTSGLNRYKTGIFTDNFSNFDNADYTNAEWNCNIDAIEQSLRSNYNAENIPLKLNAGKSANIKTQKKTATLPYTTTVWAENNFVTDTVNVQNLLFYTWKGNITLTPSIDTWVNNLGQFVVSTKYSESAKPPSTYRTWSTTQHYTNHQNGVNWGYGNYIGKEVTTSYSQETTYTGSWTVSDYKTQKETQDEFMRQSTIKYDVTGLRPGVPVTATLDGKEVTLTNAVPDSDGKLSGTFVVPENIPCGTKLFAMKDSEDTSTGEAYFTSKGKTVWTEIDRTYIRKWTPVTLNAKVSGVREAAWDPIAESIYIEDADGIYADSVDVYFKTKDSTNVEVWCYLVECENGIPTTHVLPFSMVSLPPQKVNVSDTGTIPTNFKFESPVYLAGKQEYAIVVATTSYEYSLFISTLGHTDLNTGIGVHEQPYLGNLFMSQNTRTWVAETQSDLTFRLHKCVFDTNVMGTAVFNLNPIEKDLDVAMATLVSNVYAPEGTTVSYAYRWNTESSYTPFENYSDIFFTSLKSITADTTNSLDVKITIKTNNSALTPEIDLEDTYGIFTNNIVTTNTESDANVYPYIAGTYISKITTLKYSSDNIRCILDAICPNDSAVDVYFKANTYNPVYVLQSTKGSIGISTSSGENLRGKSVQMYYYNSVDKVLEPQSEIEITGYSASASKIYLRAVSDPDAFKTVSTASSAENQYTGLDSKYTHILLIPIFSKTKISVDTWNSSSSYKLGDYVFYNGYMWQALRNVEANQIPTDMSISWKMIHVLKTVSTVKQDEQVVWRPMTMETNNNTTLEKGNSFIEYTYYPKLDIESEFQTFAVKLVLKSKDKINIPRVRNLRVISTL